MGFSFKKFAARAERTAEFVLDTVSEDPEHPVTLVVRHAGEGNRSYLSAALKGANAGRARAGRGRVTPAALQMAREEDAALFAQHVVVDWKNAVGDDGKPVPFTADACEQFLVALADPKDGRPDVFGALVAFCQNPENFRDPVGSVEDLGKG
jgi:hypothetical protein